MASNSIPPSPTAQADNRSDQYPLVVDVENAQIREDNGRVYLQQSAELLRAQQNNFVGPASPQPSPSGTNLFHIGDNNENTGKIKNTHGTTIAIETDVARVGGIGGLTGPPKSPPSLTFIAGGGNKGAGHIKNHGNTTISVKVATKAKDGVGKKLKKYIPKQLRGKHSL